MKRLNFKDTIWRDLIFGARMLRKSLGYTATVVITLGIGIGLTSSIFAAVSGILLREPPVKQPERIFAVTTSNPSKGDLFPTSPREFAALSGNHAFSELAAASYESQPMIGKGEPERISVARVTPNYFELLGINATLGRTFLVGQAVSRQESDAIISYDLWRDRWAQNPSIIGKTLTLGARDYVVIGVMPYQIKYATIPCEVWTPKSFAAESVDPQEKNDRNLNVLVRLRDDIDVRAAESETLSIFQQLGQVDHRISRGETWVPSLIGLREFLVGPNIPRVLLLVIFVVGFVLLIACANVAGITLARSAARQNEFAVRVTLGAERHQLIQQLLVESVLLASISGAFAVVLALWGVTFLRARLQYSPSAAWLAGKIALSGTELVFALSVTCLAVLIFGLWPALQSSKPDLQGTLKEASNTASQSYRRSRVQVAIVLGEITVATLLIFTTAASIQLIVTEMTPKLGFDPERVLTLRLDLSGSKYEDPDKETMFFDKAVENLRMLPGVAGAAVTQTLPESAPPRVPLEMDNQSFSTADERSRVARYIISPDYLGVMKIPIVRGRGFSRNDRPNSPGVAIVNETFAHKFLSQSDPIGRRVRIYESASNVADSREIVGVVGDVIDFVGQNRSVPQIYVPFLQQPSRAMVIVLRTMRGDPFVLAQASQNVIRGLDKTQPIERIQTMTQVLERKGSADRLIASLLATFTAVALCLSTIGIYGLISYMVTQRTSEIGLRMALGAQRRDIFGMIASKAMKLATLGSALGFLTAILISRSLVMIRPESVGRALVILGSATALLVLATLLACYVPAKRAMRLDPNVALRHQ
jgi:putative ABC transport system permease protein